MDLITFSMSKKYADKVVSEIQGGIEGNGIASTILNDDYTLTITYTDGTSYTTSSIRGATGNKGDNGYTPIKGTDYWTDEDVAAMVQDVLASLPTYNGEVS